MRVSRVLCPWKGDFDVGSTPSQSANRVGTAEKILLSMQKCKMQECKMLNASCRAARHRISAFLHWCIIAFSAACPRGQTADRGGETFLVVRAGQVEAARLQ